MSTGLRWTSEEYEKAKARAKFAQPVRPPLFAELVATLPIVRPDSLAITLPFPPTVNHMHVNGAKVRYRSKAYVAFCGLVANIVEREKIASMGSNRLAIAITLHGPNKRAFDIDNRVKPVLDALQRAGLYADDESVDRLTITRGAIVKGGLCEVEVASITLDPLL